MSRAQPFTVLVFYYNPTHINLSLDVKLMSMLSGSGAAFDTCAILFSRMARFGLDPSGSQHL